MKTIVSSDLEDKVRKTLLENCSNRDLSNKEDFAAVMSAIKSVIDGWMKQE